MRPRLVTLLFFLFLPLSLAGATGEERALAQAMERWDDAGLVDYQVEVP